MNRHFARHLGTMVAGSGLAYAIPLLALPVLSRLYSPEQFGVVGSVAAVAALSALFLTLRYELAVVLPREDDEAEVIAAVTASIALLAAIPLTIALYGIASAVKATGRDIERIMEVAWWIPPYAILIAWTQVGISLANRKRMYPAIATVSVSQQLGTAGLAVLLGGVFRIGPGLVVARVVGQLLAVALFAFAHGRWLHRLPALLSDRRRAALLREHYRFPLFNVPYSLLGTFSREALVLLFTAFGNLAAAGHYGLARMLLMAPASLLSASLSQIFYREAVSDTGTPVFRAFTYALQRLSATLGAIPFGFLAIYGPEVFGLAFGARWHEAGRYVALLSPVAVLAILTSWPERIFEVRRRQSLALSIQLIFDSAAIGSIAWLLAHGEDPYIALRAFAAIQIVYHLCYLAAVYRLAAIGSGRFAALIGKTVAMFIVPFALDVAGWLLRIEDSARIIVVGALSSAAYGLLVTVGARNALKLLMARQ